MNLLLEMFIIFFFSGVFHELGHYLYAKHLKANPRFISPLQMVYNDESLSKEDIKGIYEVGIIFGAECILMFIVTTLNYWHYLVLILYFIC